MRNEKKSNNTESDMVIIPTKNSMNVYWMLVPWSFC